VQVPADVEPAEAKEHRQGVGSHARAQRVGRVLGHDELQALFPHGEGDGPARLGGVAQQVVVRNVVDRHVAGAAVIEEIAQPADARVKPSLHEA
jgi:hypothetical protein